MAVILQLKGPLAPLILSSGCCLDRVFVHILCYSPCMVCNCLATSAPGEGSGSNTVWSDKKAMGNAYRDSTTTMLHWCNAVEHCWVSVKYRALYQGQKVFPHVH